MQVYKWYDVPPGPVLAEANTATTARVLASAWPSVRVDGLGSTVAAHCDASAQSDFLYSTAVRETDTTVTCEATFNGVTPPATVRATFVVRARCGRHLMLQCMVAMPQPHAVCCCAGLYTAGGSNCCRAACTCADTWALVLPMR
jgi:hypothetical protein